MPRGGPGSAICHPAGEEGRGPPLGSPLDARTGHITFGASTLASADAFPDSTFAARVSWLAPVVDPSQGTVEVRLAIPNPPKFLRTDMTMSVNVEVERRRQALVVPSELVGDIGTDAPLGDDRA